MKKKLKKILPRVQKNISGFLTDESGKITKKDALALSLGSTAAFVIPFVFGKVGDHVSGPPHSNNGCEPDETHSNGFRTVHSNTPYPWSHLNQAHANGYNVGSHLSAALDTPHSIPNVNGHFSGIKENPGPGNPGHASANAQWAYINQSSINERRYEHNSSTSQVPYSTCQGPRESK